MLQKSGIIISINPPYTDMILSGYKPMEFRRQVLKDMLQTESQPRKLYIYETKNKKGCGKVIGEATFPRIYPVNYRKDDDNHDYPSIAQKLCVENLYKHWSKYPITPKMINDKPWLNNNEFLRYKAIIGFGDDSNFDYAIDLEHVIKYDQPKDITEFLNKDGQPMKRPPQNMCYCYAAQ